MVSNIRSIGCQFARYSDWPTIPQVYLKGEFIGGCDIVLGMHQSGELATVSVCLWELRETASLDGLISVVGCQAQRSASRTGTTADRTEFGPDADDGLSSSPPTSNCPVFSSCKTTAFSQRSSQHRLMPGHHKSCSFCILKSRRVL